MMDLVPAAPRLDEDQPRGLNVLLTMNSYRKSEMFCDIIIKAGEKKFYCHRLILSAAIPYFDRMFGNCVSEKNIETVIMNQVDEEAFQHIIDYIYGEESELNVGIVMKMLTLAKYLAIECLTEKCLQYLQLNVMAENVLDILLYAIAQDIENLSEFCTLFIIRNFHNVYKQPEFRKIPYSHLYQIVTSLDEIVNENSFWIAVAEWVSFNLDERRQHIRELCDLINFKSAEVRAAFMLVIAAYTL